MPTTVGAARPTGMATDRHVRAELVFEEELDARGDPVPHTVRPAWGVLQAARDAPREGTVDGGADISPEALVLAAEAAVDNGEVDIATDAVTQFFESDPPENQALVEAEHASKLNGIDAVRRTKRAIAYVMRALDIAERPENKDRYAFLVYNASVFHWKVARPLLHDGARKFVCESLQRVVSSLEAAGDPDVRWRTRNQLALAMAYDEAGESAKANSLIASTVDLGKGILAASRDAVVEEARRVQVHTVRGQGAAGPKGIAAAREACIKDAEAAAAEIEKDESLSEEARTARASVARAKGMRGAHYFDLQCVLSGMITGDEAREELKRVLREEEPSAFDEYNELVNPDAATEEKKDGGADDSKDMPGDAEIIATVGRLAVRFQMYTLAQVCVDTVARSKASTNRARVMADYVRVQLLVHTLATETTGAAAKAKAPKPRRGRGAAVGPKMDVKRVEALKGTRRIDAIKLLDRALTACRRVDDANLMEEGCVLAWNVGLPLLQPGQRRHVHRLYATAAEALEALNSPMVKLRAQLHLEVARCEMATDFLAKASVQVSKALSLDYGGVEEEENPALKGTSDSEQRRLDRYLMPLAQKLELKSSLYKEPDGLEDQAMLLIEQAKDASEATLADSLLQRAVAFLTQAEEAAAERDAAEREAKAAEAEAAAAAAAAATEAEEAKAAKGKKGKAKGKAAAADESKDDAAAGGAQVGDNGEPLREGEKEGPQGKYRSNLWGELAKLAWSHRLGSLASTAAQYVRAYYWHPEKSREMVLLQSDVDLLVAETIAEDIKGMSEHSLMSDTSTVLTSLSLRSAGGPSVPTSASGLSARTLGLSVPGVAPSVTDAKVTLVKALVAALRRGKQLKLVWLVENACVYLWNYHLPLFQVGGRAYTEALPELLDALREGAAALRAMGSEKSDVQLRLFEAAAVAAEARGDLDTAEACCVDALTPAEDASLETVGPTLGVGRPFQLKGVLTALARVRVAMGLAPRAVADGLLPATAPRADAYTLSAKVIGLLEGLLSDKVGDGDKPALINEGIDTMRLLMEARDVDGGGPEARHSARRFADARHDAGPDPLQQALALRHSNEVLAIETELWVRLAREGLHLGLHAAQVAASEALKNIPDDEAARDDVTTMVWRWWSLGESVWGQSIASLADPKTQERNVTDELRRGALQHLSLAVQYAARAGDAVLAKSATRHAWNTAIPLAGSPVTRAGIMQPVRSIVSAVTSVRSPPGAAGAANDGDDLKALVALYSLLFDCHKDREEWAEGLSATEEAFHHVPPSHQRALWSARVVFMSKLGKNVSAGLAKMKESSAQLQAKVWASLARSSSRPADQLSAYLSALQTLGGCFARANALVDYAEWLHTNRFPASDAADQITNAVDMLYDVLHPPEERDDEDDDDMDDEASYISGRSGRSGARGAGTGTASRGGASKSRPGSRAGGRSRAGSRAGSQRSLVRQDSMRSTRSGRSAAGSVASRAASRVGGRSLAGRSEATKADTVGTDPKKGPTDWPKRVEVPHLLMLARCFTMLAQISQFFPQRVEYLLLAAHHVAQAWELTTQAANDVAFVKAFKELGAAERDVHGDAPKWVASTGQKPKWPAPLDAVEWLTYEPAAEMMAVVAAIAAGTANTSAGELEPESDALAAGVDGAPPPQAPKPVDAPLVLCKATVANAAHTLHYLQLLNEMLVDAGYALHCAPVHHVCRVIAETAVVPQLPPLLSLVHRRAARWLEQCNQGKLALARMAMAPPLTLTEDDRKVYGEDVALREDQARNEAAAARADAANAKKQGRWSKLAPSGATGADAGTTGEGGDSDDDSVGLLRRKKLDGIAVRELWVELAALALDDGDIASARSLSAEALRHANAYDDGVTKCRCRLVMAALAQLDGDTLGAVRHVIDGQAAVKGDVPLWAESVAALARYLRRAARRTELKAVLIAACDAFDAACYPPTRGLRTSADVAEGEPPPSYDSIDAAVEPDLDALVAASAAHVALADFLAEEAISVRESGSAWAAEWAEAEQHYRQAVTPLQQWGGHAQIARALLAYADAVLRVPGVDVTVDIAARVAPDGTKLSATDPDGAGRLAALRTATSLLEQACRMAEDWQNATTPPGLEPAWIVPAARLAAESHARLAALELELVAHEKEVEASSEARAAAAVADDPVAKWLLESAPQAALRRRDLALSHDRRALLAATSANAQLATSGKHGGRALTDLGRALMAVARAGGAVDPMWWVPAEYPAAVEPPDEEEETLAAMPAEELTEEQAAKREEYARKRAVEDERHAQLAVLFEENEALRPPASGSHALQLLSQARACLGSAVRAAMTAGDWDSVGVAMAEMAQGLGSVNAVAAAACIASYQSCVARKHLMGVFTTAGAPNSRQRLFLELRESIGANREFAGDVPVFNVAGAVLDAQSPAWRMLDCSANAQDVFGLLPPSIAVIVLQRAPSGRELLVAVVEPADKDAPAEDEEGKPNPAASVRAAVVRIPLGPEQRLRLAATLRRVAKFRTMSAKFLQNYGEDAGPQGDAYPVLDGASSFAAALTAGSPRQGTMGDESIFGGEAATARTSGGQLHDKAEDELFTIIQQMRLLLEPTLRESHTMRTAFERINGEHKAVHICAQRDLAQLPLEALGCLDGASAVTRDFSLHVTYNRMRAAQAPGSEGPPELDAAATGSLDDLVYVCDPRAEDAPKTGGGAGGAGSVDSGSVDTASLGGTATTLGPPGSVGSSVRLSLAQSLAELKQSLGSDWKGVVGSEHIPSIGEWQRLLAASDGGGFLYYGPGRYLAYMPPSAVAGLNLARLRYALIIDGMQTDGSSRRQSKLDNQKPAEVLALEAPWETAALLSLSGVGAVLVNQWSSSFHVGQRMLPKVLAAARDGQPLPAALRSFMRCDPAVMEAEFQAERAASMGASGGAKKGKAKKGKKGGKPKTPKGGKPKTPKGGKKAKSPKKGGRPGTAGSGASGDEGDAVAQIPHRFKFRVAFNPVVYGLPSMKLQ